ncbi:MAG TPA: HAMP domain-containing sensor histidine kinase, partial [Agitococcus sp.]|nr:HAMP domain-containing sensor histidine kinase [Agitococcus sp.]
INDILDLEKIESGHLTLNMVTVDLLKIAQQAVIANEGYAAQHQVSLVLKAHVTQAMVHGDEHRLLQVFANLISNAVKYSPAHGVVEVSLCQQQEYFKVSVKDYGQGIPEQFRAHIFNRFAQADSSDTRAKGGTGLGLSITKAIIERHGGTLAYQSQQGVGTEFYFILSDLNT